ncbi:MAG: T9SS type A sorting domain-containing protein [Bacteroidales bacterium]|nr:T9SS type A sorting domain-containing protein [Bacteroidales bacterium]
MKKLNLISVFFLAANLMFAQYNKIDTSFYSPSLNLVKMVDVLLPPNYYTNPNKFYPVVYFLHGADQNQNSYPALINWTHNLIQDSIIRPIILVKPDGSSPPYAGSCYTNSELYGLYEDYIINDLITWIDSTFRTIPVRQFRCISGHSMGGFGSACLAAKHPDDFCAFVSYAGLLNLDTIMPIWIPLVLEQNGGSPPYTYTYNAGSQTNCIFTLAGAYSPNMNNPPNYVDFLLDSNGDMIDSVYMKFKQHDATYDIKQISPVDDLGIFFTAGTNDELYCTSEAFQDTLDMLGLEYEFLTTNGNHTLTYEMVSSGLKFMDSLMYLITSISEVKFKETFTISPNPLASKTDISYTLNESSHAILKILDISGREIITLVNEVQQKGEQRIDFNTTGLPAGIYFCVLKTNERIQTKKMIKL